jgi:outer membrane protease
MRQIALALTSVIVLANAASAADLAYSEGGYKDAPVASSLPPMTAGFSIGVLNGKAQEYVYDAGRTLSRLDWRTENVAMFQSTGSLQLTHWLRAGFSGAMNLSSSGKMDDYDFDTGFCPPSTPGHDECHSSSKTQLRQASLLDAYLSAKIFDASLFTVSALIGDKYDYYRWQDSGGVANYATLPPGNGITYEQTWNAPYLGLGVSATSGRFTFNGRVIGSVIAKGKDKDNHHLRSLQFNEWFGNSDMIGADAGIAYRISSSMSLTLDYRYQNWMTAKGSTDIGDLQTGTITHIGGDSAGGNNVTHTVSLGVKVDLDNAAAQYGSLKDEPAVAWRGWYAGAAGGWDRQQSKWTTTAFTPPFTVFSDSAKATLENGGDRASLFLGRAWNTGRYTWGFEGDFGASNTSAMHIGIPGTNTAAAIHGSSDLVTVGRGWDASIRARAGYLATPALELYATGGVAFGEVKTSMSCPEDGAWCIADRYEKANKVQTGYTVGGGYEWSFANKWFTRGEYRYTALGDFSHTYFANAPIDSVAAKVDTSSHQVNFGVGYRF